jgi:Cytochrome c peroxidase|nr:MAG: cytochrome-c peroxidase [Pseudomonadota bacterium]
MKLKAVVTATILAASTAFASNDSVWQALPEVAPAPADNPTTQEKIELGRMLYFDPRLSSTGTVSCFSCHNLAEGGDDHRPTSVGVHGQKGGRNAPTVWNAAFLSVQFWDGRAPTLEEQAKGPPVNPIEMGMSDLEAVVERVKRIPGYRPYFEAAFGKGDVITIDNIARAIAAYERTLITPDTPYDRYVKGDKSALTEQQIRGMNTFREVGCISCHQGPMFAGPQLPMGTGFFMKFPTVPDSPYVAKYRLTEDKGRFEVTGDPADEHMWRVPTLRNLVYTAPYMHNGAVKTLPEAVRVMASTQLGLTLTEDQVNDIVAFLEALSGPLPQQTVPQLPPTPGDLLDP